VVVGIALETDSALAATVIGPIAPPVVDTAPDGRPV
jgi:hypothetical protein